MDFYYCFPFPYQISCRRLKMSTKDIRRFSKDFNLEKLVHFPFWGKRCINSAWSKLFHSKLHCSKTSPDCGPRELPKLYWSLGGYSLQTSTSVADQSSRRRRSIQTVRRWGLFSIIISWPINQLWANEGCLVYIN